MNTQCGYDVRISTKVSSLPVVAGEHVDWYPVTFCIMKKKKKRVAMVTHIPEHRGSGVASTEAVDKSAQVQVRRFNPTQAECFSLVYRLRQECPPVSPQCSQCSQSVNIKSMFHLTLVSQLLDSVLRLVSRLSGFVQSSEIKTVGTVPLNLDTVSSDEHLVCHVLRIQHL